MILDVQQLTKNEVYHTITQTLIPRPIAWVLSLTKNSHYNIAPFSYFTAVASEPPLLMFSVDEKSAGKKKDTVVNIEQNPDFVVHIAQAEQMYEVNESSRTLPIEQSELDYMHTALVAFDGFSLPRLHGAPVAYGCTLHSLQELTGTSQTLVFAKIKQIYLDDNCATLTIYEDKHGRQRQRLNVDAQKINPLSRLGAGEYGQLGGIQVLPRPR